MIVTVSSTLLLVSCKGGSSDSKSNSTGAPGATAATTATTATTATDRDHGRDR